MNSKFHNATAALLLSLAALPAQARTIDTCDYLNSTLCCIDLSLLDRLLALFGFA